MDLYLLLKICTARKTVFSFSRRLEKMVFPKKSCWNMIFLVLSVKMIFLFPENMILPLRRKMKEDLSQKIHGNMMFSSNVLKRWSFQKGLRWDLIFLVLSGKMVFFSRNMIFFPWEQSERRFFSRNTWKYEFFVVHVRVLQTWLRTPLSKKSKIILSRKNTPEGDWRSRLTF